MAQNLKAFLDKQVADRWGPSKNEANAISALLLDSLEYDETARHFIADCTAARTPSEARGHLPPMWKLVENIARKYPEHHKKAPQLVGLLDSVHGLPDLVIRDETAVKWSDLPFLVEGWDQIYNRPENQHSEENVFAIAFIAKLLSAQLLPRDEFLRWVDLDMCTALERGPEDPSALKKDDLVLLNVNVPIAAQWIQQAGSVIWNCESDLGLSKRQDGLWQGNAGFSYGRWKFWKERATWVTQSKLVSPRTRDFAKEMVEEMTSIEKQDGL
ncbi:hypothetical protein PG994_005876 [Apiospora phragmitis]|uniref:Uncharacterized protein n=1 Tax=Apiospora phragmitis TaxID=2905665 RepID=A0ABR1VG77_9PEZI